jgi:hypothetical protein
VRIRPTLCAAVATVIVAAGCSADGKAKRPPATQPAAVAASDQNDPEAVDVAQRSLARMGGLDAWEQTRVLTWVFFGRRRLYWDTWTDDVRVESDVDGVRVVAIMNVQDGAGRIWRDGVEVTDPDELVSGLELARRTWINDSYWLVMPYKLFDSGVRLRYVGETGGETDPTDVIEVTFDGVGVTPQNKYHVYFSKRSGLVSEWAFFENTSDDEPKFVLPWRKWLPYGPILLSGDRGEAQLSEIAVFDDTDPLFAVFTTPPEPR